MLGDRATFGINSSCKENVKIGADVTVGMASAAGYSLPKKGNYVGVPAVRREQWAAQVMLLQQMSREKEKEKAASGSSSPAPSPKK